ncbi:unnamed protein product [Onchocerca flexuosa]|uniref:N-acetyltransferase domain-containing protein n=1 Tax=Onchocerca flexuosa TaxID=387005 RepID=A0A183I049_9BILA|nr:unnamed protein product [Onchocerca flexuosa]
MKRNGEVEILFQKSEIHYGIHGEARRYHPNEDLCLCALLCSKAYKRSRLAEMKCHWNAPKNAFVALVHACMHHSARMLLHDRMGDLLQGTTFSHINFESDNVEMIADCHSL